MNLFHSEFFILHSAVLSKDKRHGPGEFQRGKVITDCDNLITFFPVQLKHEFNGKSFAISFYRLVENACLAIQFREMAVYHYFLSSQEKYPSFDQIQRNNVGYKIYFYESGGSVPVSH